MTQNEHILRILEKGRSLTPIEALNEVGTIKLATRVSELRSSGHQVKDEWVDDPLTGKRYKRYFMSK